MGTRVSCWWFFMHTTIQKRMDFFPSPNFKTLSKVLPVFWLQEPQIQTKSKVLSASFCVTEVVTLFWNWWDKIDVCKYSGAAQRLRLRLQLVESILSLETLLLHIIWRWIFAGLLGPWLWKGPNPCRWYLVSSPDSACYLQESDPPPKHTCSYSDGE